MRSTDALRHGVVVPQRTCKMRDSMPSSGPPRKLDREVDQVLPSRLLISADASGHSGLLVLFSCSTQTHERLRSTDPRD